MGTLRGATLGGAAVMRVAYRNRAQVILLEAVERVDKCTRGAGLLQRTVVLDVVQHLSKLAERGV